MGIQFLDSLKQRVVKYADEQIEKERRKKIRDKTTYAHNRSYYEASVEIAKMFREFFKKVSRNVILLLLPLLLVWLHMINKSIAEYLIAGVYLWIVFNFIKLAIEKAKYVVQFIFEYKMNPKAFAKARIHKEIVEKGRKETSVEHETWKEKIAFHFSSSTKKSEVESAIDTIAHVAAEMTTRRIFMRLPLLLVPPVVSFIVYITTFQFVIVPFLVGDSLDLDTLNIAQLAILPITMSIDKILGSSLSQLIIS